MKLKSMAAFTLMAVAAILFIPAGAHAQSTSYTYAYEGPALPIFRDGANIITVANIFVPRTISITSVTANIEIDYPRPGDLNIYMYSPILTRTKLLEKNCGTSGSVANVTFDDSAPSRYSDVCPSTPGSYRGNEPLSNFSGQNSLGTWSLAVENNGSNDFIGYVRGFTLTITGFSTPTTKPITGPNAVFNAAGFQSGVVAPGEMINIQGVNLGPTPAVLAPTGDLPATLGGVQVTFDGTAAAISYVSASVLAVQVPFSLQPGGQTSMRVVYQNNSSDPVTLDVLTAVPGIYTQSGNPGGVVNAINQDGSINSVSHPAPKGSYVYFYASGLGTVTPALATGQTPPSSPLSNTAPISAFVDGASANVLFSGAAPSVPGAYQINLTIPTGARTGNRNLFLLAGGAPSQFGVTIWVQ